MAIPKTVYLAGPDVFLSNAAAIGAQKKQLCLAYGFEGLFPLDSELEGPSQSVTSAREIYRGNVALMQAADFTIVNLTPFRGPSADVGTAFELGMIAGMGKPALGYTNDSADLMDRLRNHTEVSAAHAVQPRYYDQNGMTVENFGLFDNLMIACCLEDSGTPVVRRNVSPSRLYTDMEGFIECLRLAQQRWPGTAEPRFGRRMSKP
jgi:nucleoside 2-deoxyribosyltransferase